MSKYIVRDREFNNLNEIVDYAWNEYKLCLWDVDEDYDDVSDEEIQKIVKELNAMIKEIDYWNEHSNEFVAHTHGGINGFS